MSFKEYLHTRGRQIIHSILGIPGLAYRFFSWYFHTIYGMIVDFVSEDTELKAWIVGLFALFVYSRYFPEPNPFEFIFWIYILGAVIACFIYVDYDFWRISQREGY